MKDVISSIASTPVPTVFVIAGLILIVLSLGVQLKTSIVTTNVRSKIAGIVGTALTLAGSFLYLIPYFLNSPIENIPTPTQPAALVNTKSNSTPITPVDERPISYTETTNRIGAHGKEGFYKTLKKSPSNIISINSKRCLDIKNRSLINGAQIQQWKCVNHDNQKWELIRTNDDYFQIRSIQSKKCLDIKNGSLTNGAQIQQWECVNHDNQKWELIKTNDDYFQIRSVQSKKCLDIKNRSLTNGAQIQQWKCVNHNNQKWDINTP